MARKKKIFIFALFFVIIVAAIIAWFLLKPDSQKQVLPDNYDPNLPYGSVMEPQKISEPEFMSAEERALRGLAEYPKVQVLKRDESGKATAYKIIKDDSHIITDFYSPEQVSEIQSAIASSSPDTVSAIMEAASNTPEQLTEEVVNN